MVVDLLLAATLFFAGTALVAGLVWLVCAKLLKRIGYERDHF